MSIRFEDLGLSREILMSVQDMGFEVASPIQELAIPRIMSGKDVIGQAQTGTGKTAAFGIPLLERLDDSVKGVQVLVLCPTRELAIQVADEIGKLAANTPRSVVVPIYGGQSIEVQFRALARGAQIVVGTPGRIMDHMERKTLKLDSVSMAVLDEADEMLNMGFRDDIEAILQMTAHGCQKVLFSATMPPAIQKLAERFQNNPEILKVPQKALTVNNIEQIYFEVRPHQKMEALCRLLDSQDFRKVLIFCSTKRGVDEMTAHLQSNGYPVDGLHGNLSQAQRDRVMARFRSGGITILTATDVAARGLDVDDVDGVINYDIPNDVGNYVHRIGRTGRAGRTGKAFTFSTAGEIYKLRTIMRYTKAKIEPARLPSPQDVAAFQTSRILTDVRTTMNAGGLERYDTVIGKFLEEGGSGREMAVALLKMLMQRTFGIDDIQLPAPASVPPAPVAIPKVREIRDVLKDDLRGKEASAKPEKQQGMVWLAFSIGRKSGLTPKDMMGAIVSETGVPGRLIGTIEIHDSFSLVDVAAHMADEIMATMNGCQILGTNVSVKPAQATPSFKPPKSTKSGKPSIKPTGAKRNIKPGKPKKYAKK